jgi:hypothetical protein
VQPTDDPGPGAGAGVSPTDPGTPADGRDGDEAGDAAVEDDELVSAVEDLVRDLLHDGDAPEGDQAPTARPLRERGRPCP